MAVTESDTTRTSTVALADHGMAVPDEATCDVTLVGDVTDRFELVLERPDLTIVAVGAAGCAELEQIYDGDGPIAKPSCVPSWVELVAATVGIDEVAL